MPGLKVARKFDASQDMMLKMWKDETIGILAGIYSYKGGPPKFQIGPRLSWRKNAQGDLFPTTLRVGRLHKDDCVWLRAILDEVIETFDDLRETRFVEGEYKGTPVGDDSNDLTARYNLAAETEKASETVK